jgi:antibiotic biosynthesis monooxygenase (ABM) superfamily enzyme
MQMAAEDQERGSSTPGVVHVAILRVVKPGRELEFEKLIQEFFAEAAQQPGVAGAYLLRPFAGAASREYGILRSFKSAEHRDRFYRSDLYQRWTEAVSPLVEGEPKRQHLHGMEAFFRESASSPPRWKMALLTWVGVDIAVYAFASAVPRVVQLPGVVNFFLVNALVVVALTWILMPLITKLFDGWLRETGS